MPVKDAGLYLEECLDSILSQSMSRWELITIDDHSSDDSSSILKKYADKDQRITYADNQDTGIIDALRLAYYHAKGAYITRMDADDYMSRDKLALMYNKLIDKGVNHVSVGLVKYVSDGPLGEGYLKYAEWLNKLTRSESNFSDIYKECSIPSPCWMMHKDDLDRIGGFSHDVYPEDYDLAFRMKKGGLKIVAVDAVLHYWRDHPIRSSRTDDNYADNKFSSLKVHHFLDQDYKKDIPLFIWGAGRKGKAIARLLTDRHIKFAWVCDNPKKIGHDIYGVTLQDISSLKHKPSCQVIIAVSALAAKEEIENYKRSAEHEYYNFC